MAVRYVTAAEGQIDAADRGLAYGDGLFETMAVRRGAVRFLDWHLDRLLGGADSLEIPAPSRTELAARIGGAIDGIAHGTLKLILTRGSGPRGYAPPTDPTPTLLLMPSATRSGPGPERRCGSALRVVSLSSGLGENVKLAGIKHLNRLEQVLGRIELSAHDADEGLMQSTGGHVIGGTSRNLFAVVGGELLTPRLDRAGIRGVVRRAVLEACPAIGIAVRETELGPDDLRTADELFMTNALVGVESIATLDGRELRFRDVANRLRKALGLDDDA